MLKQRGDEGGVEAMEGAEDIGADAESVMSREGLKD